jgi:uncharacterized membrane protein
VNRKPKPSVLPRPHLVTAMVLAMPAMAAHVIAVTTESFAKKSTKRVSLTLSKTSAVAMVNVTLKLAATAIPAFSGRTVRLSNMPVVTMTLQTSYAVATELVIPC